MLLHSGVSEAHTGGPCGTPDQNEIVRAEDTPESPDDLIVDRAAIRTGAALSANILLKDMGTLPWREWKDGEKARSSNKSLITELACKRTPLLK